MRKLRPSLGLIDATTINIGAIIGAGIFVVTGITAGLAGPALVVSILVAAVISFFTALSFAELTAWRPREGSVYEFAHELLSPFSGFVAGWMWMLSNIFGGAAVSLAFAHYFATLFPVLSANWVAAILCVLFTTLNFFGVRQSAALNNFLVAAKLSILTFFCIFGLAHVNTENFAPFAPFDVGVLYGACYIFFAYGGFARAAVVAEEVKDARKNVPRAILLSLVISTIFYIFVASVAVGLVGASVLSNSSSPLAAAMGATGSAAAVYMVSAGGLLATASVLLTSILGVSRVAYAMGRRKELPQALSKLHPKYNSPYYSIWMTGISMALLVLFIDLTEVVAISTFASLFYYALANVSALRLKARERRYPMVVPAVGTTTCLALLVFIVFVSPQAWIVGLAGLILGAIFYLVRDRFSRDRSSVYVVQDRMLLCEPRLRFIVAMQRILRIDVEETPYRVSESKIFSQSIVINAG